jgi:hypothetical protein
VRRDIECVLVISIGTTAPSSLTRGIGSLRDRGGAAPRVEDGSVGQRHAIE